MASVSDVAKKRLEKLKGGKPAPKLSRGVVSASDAKQVKNRIEAEKLPEGDVRRRKF